MRTTKKLYQWDTNQKLVDCDGKYVDFPIGDEVYRIEAIDKECIIPDELLQVSGTVKVYECMEYGTVKAFAFYINPRPMPPDYVFTPTQRLTFDGLVKKVDETIEDLQKRADSGEFNGSDYIITESDYDAIAAKTVDKLHPNIVELQRDLKQLDVIKADNPSTGKVGQIIAILTVDENGKPTSYQAIDKPSAEISTEELQEAVNNYLSENPIEESDPTVSDWAKKPEKPSYTAEEVGALPAGTKIPSKTSDLQNDSGFLTEHQDLSGYALKSEVPKSASDVGADASGTAESKVSVHNTATDSHNDIRELISGLTQRLNALADSDDTTLDQMSEVVAYIKSNKSLIDAITTSKINVSDIIDNMTTNVSNKPLSAAQGVALKALIDGIKIPDKLPNPQKITFAGAVTAEYDGSGAVTVTIPNSETDRIEKESTDTAVELEPNKFYIFPEMSELTITLAEPSDTGIANEYHLVFQSGATATTLSIPDAIKIPSGLSIDANKIYELSVMENCLTYQSWDVS